MGFFNVIDVRFLTIILVLKYGVLIQGGKYFIKSIVFNYKYIILK